MEDNKNTHRVDELEKPALAEVRREGDDYSALARGYRAGAVVMLGVALDKTDAESLPR